MKLSNIFNVDTSKGGGIKLFKKIIDRYNLGNEYKDLKTNIENCSSSEDEYYYYKFLTYGNDTENGLNQIISLCVKDAFINGIIKTGTTEGPKGPINAPFVSWTTHHLLYSEDVTPGDGFNLFIKINKELLIIKDINSGLSTKEIVYKGTIFERIDSIQEGLSELYRQELIDSTEEEYNNAWKDYL